MPTKPPLEVFCLRCMEHHIKDAADWARRHIAMNLNHPVVYFDVNHLKEAEFFGVPAPHKLGRLPLEIPRI